TRIDMETGRPVENPDVAYETKPQWIMPANSGAHNWEPQSWDNDQGLMYFYYHDIANFYSLDEGFVETGEYEIRERGLSLGWGEGEYRRRLIEEAGPRPDSQAYIGAFDPITGSYKWRHPLESDYNGGVVATKGDVLFHPEGTGEFTVRDTNTGEVLWQYSAPGSFRSTSVMTYQVGDTQYVATLMNGNRAIDLGGTVLAFKLNGDATLPMPEIVEAAVPQLPDTEFSGEQVRSGDTLYHAQCASCHGGIGIADEVAIVAPDLRLMSLESHAAIRDIVLGGSRAQQGMPDFEDAISTEELESIRAFIVTQARRLRQYQQNR
ncbi:c-type cytochrome, partial [Gammaproteobacteria bacterium]|nr:c-type cytochrome [Gammaproteobacteria bacterium]